MLTKNKADNATDLKKHRIFPCMALSLCVFIVFKLNVIPFADNFADKNKNRVWSKGKKNFRKSLVC